MSDQTCHTPELASVVAVNGASNGGQGSAPEIFVEAGAKGKVDPKTATTVLAALEADQDVEMEPASATPPALKAKTMIANAIQTKLQSAKVATSPAAANTILSANSACGVSTPMEGGSSSSPDTSASSSPHKRTPSTNMLETMALWLPSYIQVWPLSKFSYVCFL